MTATSTAGRRRRVSVDGWVVAGLGVTQILGYGTLYYAYAILVPSIARDFGTTEPWLYGAFSVAILVFGLLGPISGRLADRHGAPWVMTLGSGAAAVALVAMAVAPERWSFAAAVVALEVASAFVLYETAFITLVQRDAAEAKRRITQLTLIAGFASTIFWPATSWLLTLLDWRGVLLVYVAAQLFVCLPIHAGIARASGPARATAQTTETANADAARLPPPLLRQDDRRRGTWLAMTAFALSGVVLSGLSVHLVPMLTAAGLGASAALVAMVFGPAQVASRLLNFGYGAGLSAVALAVVAAALLLAGLVVPLVGGLTHGPAIALAVLLGLGSGLTSIVRGTVPLALIGPVGYGQVLGQFTLVRIVASAMAPVAMSLSFAAIGIVATLAVTTVIMSASLAAFVILLRMTARVLPPGG